MISDKVAALTAGVLKTMLFTKLKVVMAILLVVAGLSGTAGLIYRTQATEPAKAQQANERPKAPITEDKYDQDKLQGSWRMVGAEVDGLTIAEGRPEVKDTFLAFDKSSVTLSGKLIHNDPRIYKVPKYEDIKAVGVFTLDGKKNPKVIALTWETNPWNNKKDYTQRCIYALAGDSLKVCLSPPHEDKQFLPTEFSGKFGSKQLLWTFKRKTASENGAERQQPRLADDAKAKSQIKVAEPPKADQHKLQGSWRMVTLDWDGFSVGEGRPEIKENRLVIEKSSFTFYYTRTELKEPENTKLVGDFKLDTKQNPKVIVLTWKECPWNGKKDFTHEAIYAVDGDILKVCLSMADDDKKSPTEFSANADSKRAIWTFKRDPASETGREKKP